MKARLLKPLPWRGPFFLIVLTAFASSGLLAAPSPDIPDWIKKEVLHNDFLKNITLGELLTYRCQMYIRSRKLEPSCRSVSQALTQLLDSRTISFFEPSTRSFRKNPICFRKDLVRLMLQSEVYYFLREVNSGLPNNVEKFDLWSLAEKFSGSTKGALEWLGVLFQDTSEAEVSIHFLESISKTSQSTVFAANLNELKTALENLRQYSPSRHPSLFTHGLKKLYPPEVDDPKMIGGIYHYYVPAYLTQKLKEQGYPSRVASFVSFLFNYIYEITTAGFDSTDLIFNEPLKIESPWRIHLIFMGYLGAYSQRDPPALYSFEEVGAELRRNPASLIQDIADQ